MLEEVIAYLETMRGHWPRISRETGLTYDWLARVAQGRIPDPGVRKIQVLHDYAKQNPAVAA